jgi:L-ribulose-5-phosphate 3-epimerase
MEHTMDDFSNPNFQKIGGFSRRRFLELTSATLCSSALLEADAASAPEPHQRGPYKGKLCFFSKPLPMLDWTRLGQAVKRMGFDGIDLTVRPEGHVLPERAADDLPQAVTAIRAEGLDVPMITTALTSANDPTARPILSTAAKLGIHFFKAGYYHYEYKDVRAELEKAGRDFRGLAELAHKCGIQAGYHNHEGYIGGALWDIDRFIDLLDPKWAGYYFDARHATAEGGGGAWKCATHLVASRLKMVAVKDFYWRKTGKGWEDENCPVGEGMVDWKYVFGVIATTDFQGPISLHIEYEIPGSNAEEKVANTIAAGTRDLNFLKARLREAYETSGK